MIAVQPTRGLDVGAVETVHKLLLERRAAGAAILLISEELDELLALVGPDRRAVRGPDRRAIMDAADADIAADRPAHDGRHARADHAPEPAGSGAGRMTRRDRGDRSRGSACPWTVTPRAPAHDVALAVARADRRRPRRRAADLGRDPGARRRRPGPGLPPHPRLVAGQRRRHLGHARQVDAADPDRASPAPSRSGCGCGTSAPRASCCSARGRPARSSWCRWCRPGRRASVVLPGHARRRVPGRRGVGPDPGRPARRGSASTRSSPR